MFLNPNSTHEGPFSISAFSAGLTLKLLGMTGTITRFLYDGYILTVNQPTQFGKNF